MATAAQATPNPVTGTSTNLNVLGADQNGESALIYSWSVLSTSSGTYPSFSLNGSNAAKNSVAVFSAAGTYDLQVTVTNAGGLSTTSSVSVTVDQTLTSIVITPGNTALTVNTTQQFTATAFDQFGQTMLVQPTFNWSASGGAIGRERLLHGPCLAGKCHHRGGRRDRERFDDCHRAGAECGRGLTKCCHRDDNYAVGAWPARQLASLTPGPPLPNPPARRIQPLALMYNRFAIHRRNIPGRGKLYIPGCNR